MARLSVFSPIIMVQLAGFKHKLVLSLFHMMIIAGMIASFMLHQHSQHQRADAEHFNEVRLLAEKDRHSYESISRQVAMLTADLTRINALGQRLVNMADLDTEEFDFTTTPGLGDGEGDFAALLAYSIELGNILKHRMVALETLADILQTQVVDKSRSLTGKGWPVARGWISSPYGKRIDPINGRHRFHAGLDIAAPLGEPLHALAGGVITWAGERAGYGLLVEIDHGNALKTRYGHVQNIDVTLGQVVKKGQKIAEIGMTGRATGPHVHLEVRENGQTRDPKQYFAFNRKR